MKKMRTRTLAFITFLAVVFFSIPAFPDTVSAASTEYVTINVGSSKTLFLNAPERGVTKAVWTSNDPYTVDITSQNAAACTIKARKSSSFTIVIQCQYNYPIVNGIFTYIGKGMKDFYITVLDTPGTGGSESGSYTINASRTGLNLDMVGGPQELILTSGRPLSSTVYIDEDSSKGPNVSASSYKTEGNREYFHVYPNEVGTQTITFQLIQKKGSTLIIKNKVKVSCRVTCSHYYGKGVVTKEPTGTEPGIRTYTCRGCKQTKTEVIPAGGKQMSDAAVTLAESSFVYDGLPKEPAVKVVYNGTELVEGTDYTVSYTDQINAGNASLEVTGIGSYSGTVKRSFTIKKADQSVTAVLTADSVRVGDTVQVQASGIGSLSYRSGNEAVAAVDDLGTVTGVSAGTAEISVTASGDENHKAADATVSVTVTEAEEEPASISASETSLLLNVGESREIRITASGSLPEDGWSFVASKGKDSCFSTAWTGDWEGDSHPLTVTGLLEGSGELEVILKDKSTGQYCASVSIDVTVSRQTADLSECGIVLEAESYTYDGFCKTPAVTVTHGETALVLDRDYTVSYMGNTNAGTASVTITGKGDYTGTVSRNFIIQKAAGSLDVSISAERLAVGETAGITANAAGKISYRSSDTGVAQVSSQGVITGIGAGTAVITVSAAETENYLAVSRSYTVAVVKEAAALDAPPAVTASVSSVVLYVGERKTITVYGSGKLPKKWTFNSVFVPASYSVSWDGKWDGNSHPLTLTGKKAGSQKLIVQIRNADTDEVVASKEIRIEIKEHTTPISDCTIRLGAVSCLYDGSLKKPSVSVRKGTQTLQKGKDYEVSYFNNKNAGTASVQISGTGAYSGTATKEFTIRKAVQTLRLGTTYKSFRYQALQKKAKSFQIKVKRAKGKLSYRSSTRYLSVSKGKVRVKRRIPKGSYRITVTAAGNANFKPASKVMRIVVR